MRNVLVVCTANQCRSPMAEALIRARADARTPRSGVMVRSAGTWASADAGATGHAVAAMAERGLDIAGHRSREIDTDMVAWADIILVMTAGHAQAIAREFAEAGPKLRLISSLEGGDWDVADPVGGSLDDYRATANELERLIEAGWPTIAGDTPEE